MFVQLSAVICHSICSEHQSRDTGSALRSRGGLIDRCVEVPNLMGTCVWSGETEMIWCNERIDATPTSLLSSKQSAISFRISFSVVLLPSVPHSLGLADRE